MKQTEFSFKLNYRNVIFLTFQCWRGKCVNRFNNDLKKYALTPFSSREVAFAFLSRGSSESKRRTLLVLFLVEKSLRRINCLLACLLACLCVRTSLIGPRIMWKQNRLFSVKLDRRVIEIEELESDVSFLNFFPIDFFTQRNTFFTKKNFFIRVDRRVIGVEELESDVSFDKLMTNY